MASFLKSFGFIINSVSDEKADFVLDYVEPKNVKIECMCVSVYVCVAGRVNLIGEHIDYEGYSVLPMAIRQDTVVAIRKRDDGEKLLRIANVNDKYPMCTYPADPDQVPYLDSVIMLPIIRLFGDLLIG